MVSTNLYFLWQKSVKLGVRIVDFLILLKRVSARDILVTFARIAVVILLTEGLIFLTKICLFGLSRAKGGDYNRRLLDLADEV